MGGFLLHLNRVLRVIGKGVCFLDSLERGNLELYSSGKVELLGLPVSGLVLSGAKLLLKAD